MQLLFKKLWNREVITYLIVGVITTAINIIVYHILCNEWELENLVANVVAWAVSVLFAFVANDWIVFSAKSKKNSLIKRWIQFIGARVFSLLIDEAGMFLLVDALSINNLFSKVCMNVIVVLINYILSRWYIFR
ncbi:MAG: GtrA family protein [Velocimicrobium sp.]